MGDVTRHDVDVDHETTVRVSRVVSFTSLFLNHLCNEPSLGLYFVQTHMRGSIPSFTETQEELRSKGQTISEISYDVDLSIAAAKALYLPRAADRVRDLCAKALVAVKQDTEAIQLKRAQLNRPGPPH